MKTSFAFALAAGAVWCAFGAVDLRVTHEGEIAFGGGGLSIVCHRLGWGGLPHKIDYKSLESPSRRFWIVDGAAKLFEGRASWTMQTDGVVKGALSLTCVAPTEAQCIALTAGIPAVLAAGLGDGTAQEYELPAGTCGTLRLRFDAPVRYHAQDMVGAVWRHAVAPYIRCRRQD